MSSSVQPDMFTDPVALSTRGKTRKTPSQTADPSSSTTSTPSMSTPSTPIPFVKPRPKASSSNMTRYSPRSRAGKSTGRKNKKTSGRTCRLCGCGPFSRDTDCSRHIRKSCPRNPDAKSNQLKCAKCGRFVSRLDALQRHRLKNCKGRSMENARLGRRVAKESVVDVDEIDGDEDEDEAASDESSYDRTDEDYVDDGELEIMGNDDDYAEEEASAYGAAGHAEGSDDLEADDAEQDHDDEHDDEGAGTGSQAGGELDAARDSFAASVLLDLSSSSASTFYSPTPTTIATSSSSEDGIPVIAAAPALDAVILSAATNPAGEVLSSVPSSTPLQPALVSPPNTSPMVQVTPSAYYSYPPPARPVDVAHNSTSSNQQTPMTMSTPQPDSDLAQRESDLAEAKAKADAQLEPFAKWDWVPAFPTATDDDSDAEDY